MSKYEYIPEKRILAEQLPDGHLIIPDGTVAITSGAFKKCASISKITIPDSVTLIGWNAFEDTAWFENQPDGMVYAGKVAYEYKGDMPENTRITLREDTVGIGGAAFGMQHNLVGITIPEGVKAIGNMAFIDCVNLIDVEIPDSVEYVESVAFEGTAWYRNQPDGMVYVGRVAYDYKGTMPRKAHIVIREGTVSITNGAFSNAPKCRRLSGVTIPESVTDICTGQFEEFFDDYSKNVTIYCKEGSYAHTYAIDNGIKYKFI